MRLVVILASLLPVSAVSRPRRKTTLADLDRLLQPERCTASGETVNDEWCESNCRAGNCPPDSCRCSGTRLTASAHASLPSKAFQHVIVNLHNELRAQNCASPLEWDDKLAKQAVICANACPLTHQSHGGPAECDTKGAGENLAWAGTTWGKPKEEEKSWRKPIQSWYAAMSMFSLGAWSAIGLDPLALPLSGTTSGRITTSRAIVA